MPDSTPPPRPRTIDPTRVMELRPALSISLNRSRVYSFVSEVLSAAKQEGAYGIVLAGLVAGHAAQDILVLGFPDPSVVNTEGLAPPDDIPLLVRKDSVGPMSGSANWGREPVRFHDLLGLKALSLGVEGNTTEAGSFGGFLKATSEDQGEDQGTAFGLTAAHCLPEATAGSAVCSPSALEVTIRFKWIRQYTKYAKPSNSNRLHRVASKEEEAAELLDKAGVDENDLSIGQDAVLSGPSVGTVILTEFGGRAGVLRAYDRLLEESAEATFGASPDMVTQLDYAIVSIAANRVGGNVWNDSPISGMGLLAPNASVAKCGRSTGVTLGTVNGLYVQKWSEDRETTEIAIVGRDAVFGEKGDSGSLVVVEGEESLGAGLLIGKNQYSNFAIVTPLHAIFEQEMGRYQLL